MRKENVRMNSVFRMYPTVFTLSYRGTVIINLTRFKLDFNFLSVVNEISVHIDTGYNFNIVKNNVITLHKHYKKHI